MYIIRKVVKRESKHWYKIIANLCCVVNKLKIPVIPNIWISLCTVCDLFSRRIILALSHYYGVWFLKKKLRVANLYCFVSVFPSTVPIPSTLYTHLCFFLTTLIIVILVSLLLLLLFFFFLFNLVFRPHCTISLFPDTNTRPPPLKN